MFFYYLSPGLFCFYWRVAFLIPSAVAFSYSFRATIQQPFKHEKHGIQIIIPNNINLFLRNIAFLIICLFYVINTVQVKILLKYYKGISKNQVNGGVYPALCA
jgi:hypothetical protein